MRRFNRALTFYSLLCLACLAGGTLIVYTDIRLEASLIICVIALALVIARPELATLIVIFVFYLNLPVVAARFHHVPIFIASAALLLLVVPIIYFIFIEKKDFIIDQTFFLMLAFLVVLSASSLFAKDYQIALDWIITYVQEGLLLYFLIINAIRSLETLKRVIWVLLLACSLMAALSLYQTLTQSYENNYGGFAQRQLLEESPGTTRKKTQTTLPRQRKRRGEKRALGPVGEPNRFAQILIVILPLALCLVWEKRSRAMQIVAAIAALLIASGVLLTYSRSAFITLLLLLVILMGMRYIKPLHFIMFLGVLVLILASTAPDYYARINSIRGVQGLVSEDATVDPDGATRGRVTEMLATLHAFLDYPILGVGPGQYKDFYSIRYQLNPDIAFRYLPIPRRGHTIFEMAAETGIIGFSIFVAIAALVIRRLWRARRRLVHSRPDLAHIATAFFLSMIAYAGTAFFLHLAYQRYYWLLLAIIGAALRIIDTEAQLADRQTEAYVGVLNPIG